MTDALDEIRQQPNPARRDRSCPRVIKRARHNSYRVKRPTDRITRHPGPAQPKVTCPNALT
jgi:hypothetical protein